MSHTTTPRSVDFAHLPDLLPLHAEEGSDREERARIELESALTQTGKLSLGEARGALCVLELIFDAAGLLDRRTLAKEGWAFVSYPAYLLGRSIVESLAHQGTRFVPVEYWEQGNHRPDAVKEQQRTVLRFLETGRQQYSSGTAHPIRFVWVAWGLIRLGEQFLLRHREDKNRPEVKNYVLPGGRFSLADLPGPVGTRAALRQLTEGSNATRDALRRTLRRELNEELSLIDLADYAAKEWRSLKPYRAVEGAGNNHALTEYRIALYTIQLSPQGEVKLYDFVAQHEDEFCWFSAEDLAQHQLLDGRRAYVDAMTVDWGAKTLETLSQVPDAAGLTYRYQEETDALDIPVRTGQVFRRGKTGKEREVEVALDSEELGLISAFAWHAKVPDWAGNAPGVRLLPNGWIKFREASLAPRVRVLMAKLEAAKLTILESQQETFFRITVDPELLFFNEELFTYRLEKADEEGLYWTFELMNPSLDSPLGKIPAHSTKWRVTRNIQRALLAIEAGKDPEAEPGVKSGDLRKSFRDALNAPARKIGLRKVVLELNKEYRLAIRRMS